MTWLERDNTVEAWTWRLLAAKRARERIERDTLDIPDPVFQARIVRATQEGVAGGPDIPEWVKRLDGMDAWEYREFVDSNVRFMFSATSDEVAMAWLIGSLTVLRPKT